MAWRARNEFSLKWLGDLIAARLAYFRSHGLGIFSMTSSCNPISFRHSTRLTVSCISEIFVPFRSCLIHCICRFSAACFFSESLSGSVLECGTRISSPSSFHATCATWMATSSLRRNAPKNPTSSSENLFHVDKYPLSVRNFLLNFH